MQLVCGLPEKKGSVRLEQNDSGSLADFAGLIVPDAALNLADVRLVQE
jgi:hypothetical protein